MLDRIKRAEKSGFLSLKEYGLSEIPEEVFALVELKTLILSNNPLQTIPKQIEALSKLKILQLADCSLFDDSLPDELLKLPLEELTLANNGFTNFDKLTKIETLKRLNLAANDILSVPESVNYYLILAKGSESTRVAKSVKEQHQRYQPRDEYFERY